MASRQRIIVKIGFAIAKRPSIHFPINTPRAIMIAIRNPKSVNFKISDELLGGLLFG